MVRGRTTITYQQGEVLFEAELGGEELGKVFREDLVVHEHFHCGAARKHTWTTRGGAGRDARRFKRGAGRVGASGHALNVSADSLQSCSDSGTM